VGQLLNIMVCNRIPGLSSSCAPLWPQTGDGTWSRTWTHLILVTLPSLCWWLYPICAGYFIPRASTPCSGYTFLQLHAGIPPCVLYHSFITYMSSHVPWSPCWVPHGDHSFGYAFFKPGLSRLNYT
jgi:hypothetical protein